MTTQTAGPAAIGAGHHQHTTDQEPYAMTDQPYTEDDLRVEAARQYAALTEDADFVSIGERMEDGWVGSVETEEDGSGRTWLDLLGEEGDWTDQYETAQHRISTLISRAADLSAWAVELGADGLEPVEDHLSMKADDRPLVRIHFAFGKDMPEEIRRACIEGVGQEIARYL